MSNVDEGNESNLVENDVNGAVNNPAKVKGDTLAGSSHASREDSQHDHHQNDNNSVPLYMHPQQRQRWGDHQKHPHTNWGDIFFDLFYVAAAYNLGNVLREDPTATGLLYAAGIFFPIQSLWTFKMYFDSRFYLQDDYFHRGYEIAILVCLATAVLYIRPVAIMSKPSDYIDMFIFALSVSLAFWLAMGRLLEIMVSVKCFSNGNGLFPEAYVASRRDFLGNVIPGLLYIAATVYAGTQYYKGQGYEDEYEASSSNNTLSEYNSSNATADYTDASHRFTAAIEGRESSDYASDQDNVSVWLLLAGIFWAVLYFLVLVSYFSHRSENHKETTVPMNVDFAIHRYGEWTMLMLGESVLSLLIVPVIDSAGYYEVFVGGIVSIVLLEYLHFQSQPSDPDKHALRRSLASSFVNFWLMQVYSLSLIILGASYKMLLYEFVYEEEYGSTRRSLFPLDLDRRWLAGSATAALRFPAEDRQERIAHFFCGSLALVFFCLDVLSLAHRGFQAQLKRCECSDTHTVKLLGVALTVVRIGLIVFIATVSHYLTTPERIALVGMAVVLAQLCVRMFGSYVFDHDQEDVEEKAIERMINYNSARMSETKNNSH